jgi:hypothetical protein
VDREQGCAPWRLGDPSRSLLGHDGSAPYASFGGLPVQRL